MAIIECLIVPKRTKFTGFGKLGLIKSKLLSTVANEKAVVSSLSGHLEQQNRNISQFSKYIIFSVEGL